MPIEIRQESDLLNFWLRCGEHVLSEPSVSRRAQPLPFGTNTLKGVSLSRRQRRGCLGGKRAPPYLRSCKKRFHCSQMLPFRYGLLHLRRTAQRKRLLASHAL